MACMNVLGVLCFVGLLWVFLVENEGGDKFPTWFRHEPQRGMHTPRASHTLDLVVTGFPGVTVKSQLLPSHIKTCKYRNFVKVIEQKVEILDNLIQILLVMERPQ